MSKTPRFSSGLTISSATSDSMDLTALTYGKHYLVDFSAATKSSAVFLPLGSSSASIEITAFGNNANSYRLEVRAQTGEKIYYAGIEYDSLLITPTDYSLKFTWDSSSPTTRWIAIDWPTQDASIVQLEEGTAGGTFVGFKAPDTEVANDLIWTLPSADGTSGQVMSTDGSKNIQWFDAAPLSEVSSRISADSSLYAALNAEVLARSNADSTLQNGAITFTGVKNFQNGFITPTRLWIGTASTDNQVVSASTTAPANLPIPVSLTFTAPVTGKYRVWSQAPIVSGSGNQINAILQLTSGTGSTGLYRAAANTGVTTEVVMSSIFMLITLTANSSYTFNIQAWMANSNSNGSFRGDRLYSGVAICAELVEQTA